MSTIERLREQKREAEQKKANPPEKKPRPDPNRVKDEVSYRSGRVSYAVRNGLPAEEIDKRRQELVAAQIEASIRKRLALGIGITADQAKVICKFLMETSA